RSFSNLKEKTYFHSCPCLSKLYQEFLLFINALGIAIGAILSQKDIKGIFSYYISGNLLLLVSLQHSISLITDHSAFKFLINRKLPQECEAYSSYKK
ncbi:12438_t:CDS:2, partial [Gigaspora rosea]